LNICKSLKLKSKSVKKFLSPVISPGGFLAVTNPDGNVSNDLQEHS